MSETTEQNRITEQNAINEAWFLFPTRNYEGILRWLFFLILCCFSIAFFASENEKVLGKACVIFTTSLMMEFLPLFNRFPRTITNASNRPLLKHKRNTSIAFIVFLIIILLFSLYLAFATTLPTCFSLLVTSWHFVIAYILVFIYLFINCIMGMSYIPAVTEAKAKNAQEMFEAAETGGLGDTSKIKS